MSRRIDRRRFLVQAASLAAATAAIACGAPAPSTPRTEAKPTAPPPAPAAQPTTAINLQASVPAPASTAPPASGAPAGKYKEAPVLADLVKAGKLPPIDQRLPVNPRVLTPLEEVGQYGGTWHRAYRGLSDRWGPTKLVEEFMIAWDMPDPNTIKLAPNFVEKWEQNKDATEFTFYLRKGVKWSDGTPITAEDIRFYHEDVVSNKDLSPLGSYLLRHKVGSDFKVGDLTMVDETTLKVKYQAPNPLLPIHIAKANNGGDAMPGQPSVAAPAHYLKRFHPKYAKKEELDQLVADKKLTAWTDLWGKGGDFQGPIAFWFLNPELPVLNAWKIDQPSPADPVVMVRNPFYWKVDTEGNQLPYIDSIEHAYFDNIEVLKLWVAAGKLDMQMRHLDSGMYTFLKENEAKGDYRTLNWRSASTNALYPNLNCPDKVLAKLFDTPEFRQALNISIDRKQINEIVWNGLGKPRQYSPIKGSPEYDEGMEQQWVQYDPTKANELLDGLGLAKGGDGVRLRPDGEPLEVTIEHILAQGAPLLDELELVRKYWNAIGIRATTKFAERALYEEHTHNGEMEVGAAFGWDRASVNKADPGRWTAEIDDGPWAPNYGHWYRVTSPYKKEEPPQDHPIRKVWDLWDKTQVEPDEAKRNALFQEMIGVHKQAPFAVGTVGELVQPMIAKSNFHNVKGGYIGDDTLRDYGQINPAQFFIKK